jgi:hypothetical protein
VTQTQSVPNTASVQQQLLQHPLAQQPQQAQSAATAGVVESLMIPLHPSAALIQENGFEQQVSSFRPLAYFF